MKSQRTGTHQSATLIGKKQTKHIIMKTIFTIMLSVVLLGCLGCLSTHPSFVEGTVTEVGIYAPVEGQIIGMEVLNYVNGVKISLPTNMPYEISRKHSATNNYFGVVKTSEYSETKVKASMK